MRKQTIKKGKQVVVDYMSARRKAVFSEYDIGQACDLKRFGSYTLGARYFMKKLRRSGRVERVRFKTKKLRWSYGWRLAIPLPGTKVRRAA